MTTILYQIIALLLTFVVVNSTFENVYEKSNYVSNYVKLLIAIDLLLLVLLLTTYSNCHLIMTAFYAVAIFYVTRVTYYVYKKRTIHPYKFNVSS